MVQPTKTTKSTTAAKALKQVKTLVVFVAAFLVMTFCYKAFNLGDRIKNLGYTPSAQITSIEDKLSLTSKAKVIFHASRPQLESRDDFNQHCESRDAHISILGCYVDQTIYLYDIQSTELPGVVESTAAHELLHAVWARLSVWERANLEDELQQVYQTNATTLANDLELYDVEDRLDELHSRVGVEIKDLPEKLERHYAQYFNNQDAVVEFYNSYSEPFKQLSQEINQLSSELETMRTAIDEQTASYYQKAEALSARIAEFNNCANTIGCFNNDAEFYAQRNLLQDEQDDLEAEYYEINIQIDQYNAQVNTYNNNVLRTHTLENAINSNAPVDAL